ncbi:MAG: hypothetical protein ACRDY0_13380, partial [Acidimicrobiales bacterium]
GRPGRWGTGAGLAVLAALASPVAGAFVALVLVAWGLASPAGRAGRVVAGVVALGVVGGVAVAFPGAGTLHFSSADLACILAGCALVAGPFLGAHRPVRGAAALYGVVSVLLYVVPTAMGNNDMRLAADVGVPLVLCYAEAAARAHSVLGKGSGSAVRRLVRAAPQKRLVGFGLAAGLAGSVVWAWAPATGALGNAGVPAAHSGFYRPLLAELGRLSGGAVRVEVVPTRDHWEAEWVAPAVPLARGWERQLDVGFNPVFYQRNALTPAAYRRWLTDSGVSWVALPRAPLDFAATGEARLLRADRVPGLAPVWHTRRWELWKVVGSHGLVDGPARVTALGSDRVALAVRRPGPVVVKVRWSSHWSVQPSTSCVSRAPGGWTGLRVAAAGPVTLSASLLPGPSRTCPG